ncbi:MAG: hypothetical protein ACYDHH_01300 [Solirubrobacteraceae bacterium]
MTVVFAAPALPLHTAGPYVFAAYIVFVAMILIYVAIMAVRLGHSQRDIERLSEEVKAHNAAGQDDSVDREAESVL